MDKGNKRFRFHGREGTELEFEAREVLGYSYGAVESYMRR